MTCAQQAGTSSARGSRCSRNGRCGRGRACRPIGTSTGGFPYLARIAAAGDHPHSTAWAADPDRLGAPPQTFEAILDWLLDGLETLS
ncbi:hypothetical protein PSD17_49770 [Pseudonocardia sp. D17]|nr:hypothetical protein PSD17_49770 [Pseudonocardia sp. D17]